LAPSRYICIYRSAEIPQGIEDCATIAFGDQFVD
jgi:hypothetical protein